MDGVLWQKCRYGRSVIVDVMRMLRLMMIKDSTSKMGGSWGSYTSRESPLQATR